MVGHLLRVTQSKPDWKVQVVMPEKQGITYRVTEGDSRRSRAMVRLGSVAREQPYHSNGLNDLKWNKQMDTPRQTYTLKEATRKMERYCAYQERCHQEVAKKLAGMNMIPQAIDQIMTHLIENDFLNEERFARGLCQG